MSWKYLRSPKQTAVAVKSTEKNFGPFVGEEDTHTGWRKIKACKTDMFKKSKASLTRLRREESCRQRNRRSAQQRASHHHPHPPPRAAAPEATHKPHGIVQDRVYSAIFVIFRSARRQTCFIVDLRGAVRCARASPACEMKCPEHTAGRRCLKCNGAAAR